MKDYRFDKRDKKQFATDIQTATKIESDLMDVYVEWLNLKRDAGSAAYFKIETGINNTGEFIADLRRVNSNPDFLLARHGFDYRRHIDIKFSRPYKTDFHLKTSQIKNYIENDCAVVMFMGIETDKRKMCVITPHELQILLNEKPVIKMWQKDCIKITNKDVNWITI